MVVHPNRRSPGKTSSVHSHWSHRKPNGGTNPELHGEKTVIRGKFMTWCNGTSHVDGYSWSGNRGYHHYM